MIKKEYGQEQPYWPLGIFKIRLPLIHYRWEFSENIQAFLLCATCLGAIAIQTEVLGIPYDIAWSMVIINGMLYCLHSVMGDPVVPGWITPSIPITVAFLTTIPMGPERIQMLIALQFLVAFIFLFMGVTRLSGKLMSAIPTGIKSGILLGAGLAAIIGEFKTGGRFELYPISVAVGTIVSYYLLFSLPFRRLRTKYEWANQISKIGMLPALIIGIIIGPLVKEVPFPQPELGTIIKIPDFVGIIQQTTIFGVGVPSMELFINAIPVAIMIYIIAFGDFVTSGALLGSASKARPDEKVDFDSDRSNIISGIRNAIMGLFCPYVPMCGPLWAAVTASLAERYKDGPKAMQSIFSGVGTFRFSTAIFVALIPVATFIQPILPVALSLTMLVQGYVCTRLAMELCKNPTDMGICGVMGAVLAIKGASWGLVVGIILYLILVGVKNHDTIKTDGEN